MRWTSFFSPTLRDAPADAEARATNFSLEVYTPASLRALHAPTISLQSEEENH